ncbi:hypothetical protein E2C01_102705 [Portunus trituberculatus]|uniref:Uncharacterized protein n=1 Tax=Portunus trituberculatus TaxID=210409 RepID=A0A5B7KJ01_PORTR|nr:hypothetical protein [Portunus trituberculatus]
MFLYLPSLLIHVSSSSQSSSLSPFHLPSLPSSPFFILHSHPHLSHSRLKLSRSSLSHASPSPFFPASVSAVRRLPPHRSPPQPEGRGWQGWRGGGSLLRLKGGPHYCAPLPWCSLC